MAGTRTRMIGMTTVRARRSRQLATARLAGAAWIVAMLLALPLGAAAQAPSASAPAVVTDAIAAAASPAPGSEAGASDGAAAPIEITVGAYVNDIHEVDLRTNNYFADVYVWMRWTDPSLDPSATMEAMNPAAPWDLVDDPLYDEPVPQPDGSFLQVIRYEGAFNTELPLEKYPFDRQLLTVELEDNTYPSNALVYLPDPEGVTISSSIRIPGYDVEPPTLTIADNDYPTRFGDLSLDAPAPYSRVTITVPIVRPAFANIVKILLPILIVVLVAALTLLIRPDHIEGRIGMGITALLTIVALQFTTSQELPQVTYLTMLDVLYILSSGFVLVVMARAVWSSWHGDDPERMASTVRGDRRIVGLSFAAYLVAMIATVVLFLA